ncbi:MAG: elongation factor G, partial [Alphaproteobacteria bacterium]
MASYGTGETRVVALVGPFHSGKTTLLESIAVLTGDAHRKGGANQRLIGDASAEAKAREMGVELNVATARYMDETFTFLDCPGSIEFLQEGLSAIALADAAVIVTEPDVSRILSLAPIFRVLEDAGIPRFVLVNKIDRAAESLSELAETLERVSSAPVVLRHIPIREGDQITGYADLASGRAHIYKPGGVSEVADLPASLADRFAEDRYQMLEKLADFDDDLMEQLLEDIDPSREEVFTDLAKDVQKGLIVPVLLGAAALDQGTNRLMKALRHELPPFKATQERLGVDARGDNLAQVIKTFHTAHAGKLSVARVLRGRFKDGQSVGEDKISGIYDLTGQDTTKRDDARAGDVVGFGRLDNTATGDSISTGTVTALERPQILSPVYALALHVKNRNDEVKLSGSLAKLTDEDPSLTATHVAETQELVLSGQGEMHLQVAVEKLKSRFGIAVSTARPQVPYKETIKKPKTQHARHKKQSGGHGQFGDVIVEVKPLPSGSGFAFEEKIHGGSVPKQYIPSVEHGIKDYLAQGPLGFPVIDIGVTLIDGKYHAVDSSDMAFQLAGRQAMVEA